MDQGLWPIIIGAVVAVVGTLFGWFTNRQRANVDESALVLGKWKELVETHQTEIKSIKDEFAAYRKHAEEELSAVRQRLLDVEKDFSDYRRSSEKRMQELENENLGLRRMIAQNSKSVAYRIGGLESKVSPEDRDMVEKIDKAGHNRRENGDDKGT